MNRGQLRTQTAAFLGDPDITRFSETIYNTALDRAQEQFALDTKALWEDTSWTTVAGTAAYALPSDFQWEDWVTYDGVELTPISRHELNRRSGDDWSLTRGKPTHYIVDPEVASQTVRLYPIPDEAKTLAMRFFPLPASMASDSAVPLNSSALMAQFHLALAAYAAWLITLNELMTTSILMKRRELERIYADEVSRATETFKNTASQPLVLRGNSVWE